MGFLHSLGLQQPCTPALPSTTLPPKLTSHGKIQSREVLDVERIDMLSPKKPSLDEVLSFLARRQALIVHCSGTPKGVGPGQKPYPGDLQHVRLGHAQGGISCSVVKPGDRFHGFGRNSTGSVGLVVAPAEPLSIVAVAP